MDRAITNAYQLAKQLQGAEVEARIKGPIVREDTAKRLLATYGMTDGIKYMEQRNKANSGTQTVVYRCIDGGDIICKSKIKSFKCYNEWASIVVSTEISLGNKDMLAEKHFIETTKTRYSRLLYNNTLRLDVTHIHDDDIYQVEVEVLCYLSKEDFMQCIRLVVGVLQDSPLYISRKKFDAARCVVGGEGYYHSNTASINKKGSIEVDRTTNFSIHHGKYQKPVTLTKRRLRHIFRRSTYMTPKLDGVRRFIITFNGMIYDMDPEHMHVRLLSNESSYRDPFPSIIDTELVLGTYNIFDACVFEGWYIGNEELETRLEYAKRWMRSFPLDCVMKEYERVSEDDPIGQISNFYQRYLNGTFPIDGIVFVDNRHRYVDRVIKWKSHVTVDLLMDEDGSLDERVVADSVDTTILPKRDDGTLLNGTGVYEFEILQVDKLSLRALRFRDDKKRPNATSVITNNMDGFELRDIWNGYGCILMRRYHNAVKRKMLALAKGCTVLDVGSGQGGDVSKWRDARKVYCVEPSDQAVMELKGRLSEAGMKKKVKVIHCPISNVKKIRKRVDRIDVMTLFFTINLFTQEDLDALMEIVEIYKPTHIVGTFLDKALVRYGETLCYKITPKGRHKYRIHLPGTRINQEEYLFGLDQLRFKGYKLVNSQPLDYGGVMSSDERELSKMFSSFHFR
jgi:ubiquinone/menaquinone biosynthesis C-methylase UbiE